MRRADDYGNRNSGASRDHTPGSAAGKSENPVPEMQPHQAQQARQVFIREGGRPRLSMAVPSLQLAGRGLV
jgi:hypothetical protein